MKERVQVSFKVHAFFSITNPNLTGKTLQRGGDVLRTLNLKYLGSTPTSSNLLFCSLCFAPRSLLRALIAHGIQTYVISSNSIRRLLCQSAYQDGPSLRHARYSHCILFVFWYFCFAFNIGILFSHSFLCVCFNFFLHKLLVISTMPH